MQTKALFLFLFLMLINFAQASTVAPPDTTTNLTDRAAALLIIDEGRTLFEQGKVRDALIRFRQAAVKDPNTWKASYWIAQCHYSMNSFGYALQYGNQAVLMGKDEVNKEIYELLGKAYHRTSNLDSALINYDLALKNLSKQRVKDLLIELRIEQVKFAQAQMQSGVLSKKKAFSSDVNSGYNDYTPVLTSGGKELYFASRRSDTKGGNMNPDDQEFFEDVYRALWNAETNTWDSVTNDLGRINSDGFDAITYITPNGINGLMTVNLTATKAKKSTKGSDIFEIELSNKGLWSTPKRINNKTINTGFFEGSATMTADMNTMYFVSDRKGEKSSTDIYMVERKGKKWGEAKPLPMDKINTIGRETTPFISADGRFLFFSSDGLNGMGGLDVYVVENLGGGTWGTPVNLGIAVNSVSNDSHFQYYPELKKAVMVTFEIVGQKASLDMYEVEMSNFTFPTGK